MKQRSRVQRLYLPLLRRIASTAAMGSFFVAAFVLVVTVWGPARAASNSSRPDLSVSMLGWDHPEAPFASDPAEATDKAESSMAAATDLVAELTSWTPTGRHDHGYDGTRGKDNDKGNGKDNDGGKGKGNDHDHDHDHDHGHGHRPPPPPHHHGHHHSNCY